MMDFVAGAQRKMPQSYQAVTEAPFCCLSLTIRTCHRVGKRLGSTVVTVSSPKFVPLMLLLSIIGRVLNFVVEIRIELSEQTGIS